LGGREGVRRGLGLGERRLGLGTLGGFGGDVRG